MGFDRSKVEIKDGDIFMIKKIRIGLTYDNFVSISWNTFELTFFERMYLFSRNRQVARSASIFIVFCIVLWILVAYKEFFLIAQIYEIKKISFS